ADGERDEGRERARRPAPADAGFADPGRRTGRPGPDEARRTPAPGAGARAGRRAHVHRARRTARGGARPVIEVDVRELLAHPGSSRTHRLDRSVDGIRLELAGMPEGAAVRGDLLLESVAEGVLVSGPLRGPLTLTCARCLTEFDGSFDVRVQELFVAPGREAGPDDYLVTSEGRLDPEP